MADLYIHFWAGQLRDDELHPYREMVDCGAELYGLHAVTCHSDGRIDTVVWDLTPGQMMEPFFMSLVRLEESWVPLGLKLPSLTPRQRWWVQSMLVWFSRRSAVRAVLRDEAYEKNYDLCLRADDFPERFRTVAVGDLLDDRG